MSARHYKIVGYKWRELCCKVFGHKWVVHTPVLAECLRCGIYCSGLDFDGQRWRVINKGPGPYPS